MGAARVLEATTWTHAATDVAARRPSWLAPAPSRSVSMAPRRLSIVPCAPDADAEAEAKADATARAKAEELGNELGRRDETIAALRTELDALRETAASLAASLATVRKHVLESSEGELVGLAMTIAKRVVGDSLIADPSQITRWAKDAIASLPARETMVVAISSDLAASIDATAWAHATNGEHRLEVDATLPAGSCEVRTSEATVEVSAGARLDAVGEAIGVDP